MKRVSTLLLLLLGVLVACASAFRAPHPLRRQNGMRMSSKDTYEPLVSPPGDDGLEALERRLAPSVATLLRLASTLAMGTAYLASPVMGTCPACKRALPRPLSILFPFTPPLVRFSTPDPPHSRAPRRCGRDEQHRAGRHRDGGHMPGYVRAS